MMFALFAPLCFASSDGWSECAWERASRPIDTITFSVAEGAASSRNEPKGAHARCLSSGVARPGLSLHTTWSKLRVNVTTLQIDAADYTYATQVAGDSTIPLGYAESCSGRDDGAAVIDLRGTPFAIAGIPEGGKCDCAGSDSSGWRSCSCSQWTTNGWAGRIELECTDMQQKCTLSCGGRAGGCSLTSGYLQLEYLQNYEIEDVHKQCAETGESAATPIALATTTTTSITTATKPMMTPVLVWLWSDAFSGNCQPTILKAGYSDLGGAKKGCEANPECNAVYIGGDGKYSERSCSLEHESRNWCTVGLHYTLERCNTDFPGMTYFKFTPATTILRTIATSTVTTAAASIEDSTITTPAAITATTAPAEESGQGKMIHVGGIAGGAVGGAVFLIIFGVLVYRCGRKKELEEVRRRAPPPGARNQRRGVPQQAYGETTMQNPTFDDSPAPAYAEVDEEPAYESAVPGRAIIYAQGRLAGARDHTLRDKRLSQQLANSHA
eukprot:gene23923-15290_t